jgi:hypothetical protein
MEPEPKGITTTAKESKVDRAATESAETPKEAIDQAWNQGIEDKVIAEKVGAENDQLKDYEEIVF